MVGQALSLEEGDADNPAKTLEGRITADPSFYLHGTAFASGWSSSLYGYANRRGKRLSHYLEAAKENAQVQYLISAIRFDNIDSIKLVVEKKTPGGMRETWYFDPSREYAIFFYENSTTREQTKVDGLIESAPGVFYPNKATCEKKSKTGATESSLLYETSAVVANDSNFNDDIFKIKWPVGTTVTDEISGTTFTVGTDAAGIGQTIGDQVKRVKEAVGHPLSPQPKATGGYWIAAGWLAAIVVTGGIVTLPLWVARRRQRK